MRCSGRNNPLRAAVVTSRNAPFAAVDFDLIDSRKTLERFVGRVARKTQVAAALAIIAERHQLTNEQLADLMNSMSIRTIHGKPWSAVIVRHALDQHYGSLGDERPDHERELYYVYELIDPRDGKPFYVGKGKKARVHQHEKDARKGVRSLRCDRIREIWASGAEVRKRIRQYLPSERQAYDAERAAIAEIGPRNLTNVPKLNPVWLNTAAL